MNKEKAVAFQEKRIGYHNDLLNFLKRMEQGRTYHVVFPEYKTKYAVLEPKVEFVGIINTFNTESINFHVLASRGNLQWNYKRGDKNPDEHEFTLKHRTLFRSEYYDYVPNTTVTEVEDSMFPVWITWDYVSPRLERLLKKAA